MRRHTIELVLALAVAASLAPREGRAGEVLNIGDPAPPLTVSAWVKGDKVEGFAPNKIYVVEFWATWCGPCVQSIPHLTKLAHQYKDKGIRFVGVDIWEKDTKAVKPFVDKMGDKMDYSVALDNVPKNAEPNEGAMAKTWMDAAVESGIPTAFVIRDRAIAWIGHPLELDEPLAKIAAGTWDAKASAAERLARKTREKKLEDASNRLTTPLLAEDYKTVVKLIDQIAASDPELEDEFAGLKFKLLCNGVDIDAGVAYGTKLMEKRKDDASALNELAWSVVDPDLEKAPDLRVARLALKVARRAEALTKGEEPNYLDTVAVALYRTGDAAGAITVQEKAIKLAKAANDSLEELEGHLALFRKTAETKGKDRP